MSFETVCSNIITKMSEFQPDIIYLAVGCYMGYYTDISPKNNQQDPLFLQKFADKKRMYIFFDPAIENPLKLESQIDFVEVDYGDEYRILENDNMIVFSIKKPFYFHMFKDSPKDKQDDSGISKILLASLIVYSLENKIKLFVQDYTGDDINDVYVEFFDIFTKSEMYKYVMFDVTQNEGGCFVDFERTKLFYDKDDNFIHLKFQTLAEIKKHDENMFKTTFHKRVGWINYHVSRQIRIINGEIEGGPHDNYYLEPILKNLSGVYSVTQEITLKNLENIIMHVVVDIIEAMELPREILQHIIDNKYNQKIITDVFSPIKTLVGY